VSPVALRRLTDERLGSRLADGEAAAFDELFRRYVHRLAAYGAHLLGDGAAGDDVAQATLLKAYSALRRGQTPERVRPWLYRIAHNTALDLIARRRELVLDRLPERPAPAGAALGGALVAALTSLPDRQRRVYVLRELHGLRIDETAAELALTPSQVEQALFAARNRMAEHIVFGDRLDCVTVRRLAAGTLDGHERRALKTHFRSCAACRSELGLRGKTLSLAPLGLLDWFRGLLLGGGAPAAAKLTATVAAAGLAVGMPGAVEQLPRPEVHPHATTPGAVVDPRPVARKAPARILSVAHETTPARTLEHHGETRTVERSSDTSGHDGGGSTSGETTTVQVQSPSSDGGTSGPDGGGTSTSDGGSVTQVTTVPLATTTTSSDGGSGTSGSDGGSGSSDGGTSGSDGGSGSSDGVPG
jgi:RNA polymerase sigma-70 factor, ECF subfamily